MVRFYKAVQSKQWKYGAVLALGLVLRTTDAWAANVAAVNSASNSATSQSKAVQSASIKSSTAKNATNKIATNKSGATVAKPSSAVSAKEYASYKVFTCEHFDYCPYFTPVFWMQENVKKRLLDAFTFSSVEPPYWLRKGVENSTLPVRYKGINMLFGSTTEPENSLNGMRFLYTPKTQRVVGVWVNHDKDPVWIGDVNEDEKKVLNDYINEEGDLFIATEQTRATLPILIK